MLHDKAPFFDVMPAIDAHRVVEAAGRLGLECETFRISDDNLLESNLIKVRLPGATMRDAAGVLAKTWQDQLNERHALEGLGPWNERNY